MALSLVSTASAGVEKVALAVRGERALAAPRRLFVSHLIGVANPSRSKMMSGG